MPSLTEAVQSAIRNLTGASGQWVEDWHALFDQAGIAPGQFGERLVAYAKSVGAPSSDATAALEYFLANPNDTHFIFAGANKLSPLITFSRGTNATLFDSTGTLVYAPSNLVTYSGAFDNAAWTKTNATFTANYVVAPGGGATAGKLIGTAAGASPSLSQAVSLRAGIAYTYSVYAKAAELGFVKLSAEGAANPATAVAVNLATFSVTTVTGSPVSAAATDAGAGWVRVSFSVTATSTASGTLAVYPCSDATGVYTGDGASGLYVHGAQLNTGATLAAYNATTSAAYYGPRFDYNPSTLAARGLLIEEQRTNSIRNNTMQGAVAGTPGTLPTNWGVIGGGLGTLTQQIVGTGTSKGINYIDLRVSGTTSTTSFGISFEAITQIAAASGQTWSASVYVALISGATTNLTVLGRVVERNNTGVALINTTQDVTSLLSVNFYRSSVTRTLTDATTAFVTSDVLFAFSSGVAIDITLRIGLPQLEQGAFATSVIPTTTAAATRNADVASVNTLTPWYNANAGTLYFEGSVFSASSYRSLTYIDDGTTNNRIYLDENSGPARAVSTVGGVNQCLITLASVSANTIFKLAGAFSTNDCAASLNAGAVGTDTTATMPTVTTMRLGNDGVNFLCGYIRRISYYPSRLPNATLQSLTT